MNDKTSTTPSTLQRIVRGAVADNAPVHLTPDAAFLATVYLADADLPATALTANVAPAYVIETGEFSTRLVKLTTAIESERAIALTISVDEMIALTGLLRQMGLHVAALIHPDAGSDWLSIAPHERIDLGTFLREGERAKGAHDAADSATGRDLLHRTVDPSQPDAAAPRAADRTRVILKDDDVLTMRSGDDDDVED